MNWKTFKDATVKLLNNYSISGNLIPSTDPNTLDYTLRFPTLAQAGQYEIATTAKYIHKKLTISQNPIPNMLPVQANMFDLEQHLNTDLIDMTAVGAQSYYFEVDNVATIYIEECVNGVWQPLPTPVTINNTVKREFTDYKGFIQASDISNKVRIRFSGSYPYNVRNKALYAYLFPTVDDIPAFQRYIQYTLPDNYWKLRKVEFKGDSVFYSNNQPWHFETRNIISIDCRLVGEIDIDYYAYPTSIDDSVADSFVFDLDEEACQALIYYVASQCLLGDTINLSTQATLYAMYQGKLGNMSNVTTQGATCVKNSLFSGDSMNKLF